MRASRSNWTGVVRGLALFLFVFTSVSQGYALEAPPEPSAPQAQEKIFLPLISRRTGSAPASGSALRANAPLLNSPVSKQETAIFWFGRVSKTENYTEVRLAYTSQELYLFVSTFDRYTWYDLNPAIDDLSAWDAATLYLDLDGNVGQAPDEDAYRFTGQLSWWETRDGYQAARRGSGSGWSAAPVAFETESYWVGNAPNDDTSGVDRGWWLAYHIPFASLGLSGPPGAGTVWGMAVEVHDRDKDTLQPAKTWPESADLNRPASWGQLAFGLPASSPPGAAPDQTVTVRQGLNGAVVPDAAVGGTIGKLCQGDDSYVWNEWGNANFAGAVDFNIQNQVDLGDWPCFSKYYVTFPLEQVPAGKVITSATLTLHLWGGTGGGEWGTPPRSLIQVFSVAGDWDEATLTWNNAPLAKENIAQAWVDPFVGEIHWPGRPVNWDVLRAAAEAYAAGQPLRLAVYSADEPMHTGKFFTSSDAEEWDAIGRPTLTITWGNP